MASLDEMHEFKRHLDLFEAEQKRLGTLCARHPVEISSLTAEELSKPLLARPEGIQLDDFSLEHARSKATLTVAPIDVEDVDAWGWWSQDDAWGVMGDLGRALASLDRCRAQLDDLNAQHEAAYERDSRLGGFLSSIESYRTANKEDEEALADLDRRAQDPEAAYQAALDRARESGGLGSARALLAGIALVGAVVMAALPAPMEVRGVLAAIWLAAVGLAAIKLAKIPVGMWFKNRWVAEEAERVKLRRDQTRRRIDARASEVDGLIEKVRLHKEQLDAPFEQPLEGARAAVEDAEEAVIGVMDEDLARRCDSYEGGSLLEMPYDEALAAGSRLEWELLGRWMSDYTARLGEMIAHAERSCESELVWLEGHAPYGKRYWDRTARVISFMESGLTTDSAVALERCLKDEAS